MGRFHHSSDSDYEPTEQEKARMRLRIKGKSKSVEKEKAQQQQPPPRKKSKSIQKEKEKEKEKEKVKVKVTKAENYPLLSNYLRLYFPEEKLLEQHLSMIGEEDAASFEDSWDKIYHSEFFITSQLELLRDRFRHLIIKHLNPTSS